ncbi:hypothetical protein B0G81_7165 [Paraburkholderia sp. BL6665CI2N2]|nr:hypothetical protein B0G81_7165 [Paraburkholderia sp. BL6665CI2N2]
MGICELLSPGKNYKVGCQSAIRMGADETRRLMPTGISIAANDSTKSGMKFAEGEDTPTFWSRS